MPDETGSGARLMGSVMDPVGGNVQDPPLIKAGAYVADPPVCDTVICGGEYVMDPPMRGGAATGLGAMYMPGCWYAEVSAKE